MQLKPHGYAVPTWSPHSSILCHTKIVPLYLRELEDDVKMVVPAQATPPENLDPPSPPSLSTIPL